MGTGSGCIALALKKAFPNSMVEAWEISPNALSVAQENAIQNKLIVEFKQKDVLQAQAEDISSVDLVVSNPPYITWEERGQLAKNVVDFEPHLALFVPNHQPLLFYEVLARLAYPKTLITEIHQNYAQETQNLFLRSGYKTVTIHKDMFENERWIVAEK